jgi:hypothetical protein
MKKILFIPPIIVGFIVQAIMMYIAWVHNAQNEIHCSGLECSNEGYTLINGVYVDFSNWFGIGFSWFIPVFLLVFLLTFIIIETLTPKFYEIADESKQWFFECKCGNSKSVWDTGGIRFKAWSVGKRVLGVCSKCKKLRWFKLVKRK